MANDYSPKPESEAFMADLIAKHPPKEQSFGFQLDDKTKAAIKQREDALTSILENARSQANH